MNNNTFKVRDRRNRGWFFLDNDYLNGYAKIFGAIGTSVYLSLCRHVDNNQKCFPSEKTMAKELAVSERTIRKYLKRLEAWNLIVIEKTRSEQGKFLHNVYWLVDKSEWKEKPSANGADGTESTEPSANDDQNQRHVVPHKDTDKKNTHIKDTHLSNASVAGDEVNEIISLFKEVNPSIEKYYGNTTQRGAAERMLKVYGREKLETIIKILPQVNAKPYWKKSTTPLQLENNLPEYKAKQDEEKQKVENKKIKFVFL